MKKIFFSMLAVAALASCVKEQTLETLEPAKIGFAGAYVENATKAADPSTTTANINEFYVWGVMDNETGLVFTDETVSRSGSAWTYVNTQYWTPKHNYYFAALAGDRTNNQIVLDFAAAADNGMSVEGLGTMTFTNVSGENDVLYAEQTAETPASVNQQPADVKFQFAHLLSKVKFSFTNGFVNEHNTIVVKNIKMVVPNKGTIDLTQTDNGYVWTGLEGETTLVMGDMDAAARVAVGETASSDNERLTIPASSSQEYTVTFDVELWMGDVLASSASKTVKINGCALEPGKAYNFKATINQDNVDENPLFPIVFQAEVDEWVEAEYDGGVIATNSVSNEVELQEAINQGGLVTVASDIVLEQPLTINVVPTKAEGGVATLDLNGKTIYYATDVEKSHAMITVKAGSTLIIKDSAKDGKISFEYTGVGDPNMGWGSYTILNEGNVIVESGKVEILCGINDNAERKVYHMYSAIDQGNGSTTINGGVISNPTYRSIRVRKGSLTVNGGVMEGQVWMQANDNNSTITINGGDFSPRGVDGSSVFVTNDTKTVQLNVTGGTFATKIGASIFTKEGVKGTVKGGTFGSIDKNLVAEGYYANLIDGKYVVIPVGSIVDINGVKGIIYSITNDAVKVVSVEEKNLSGKRWADAVNWAADLGEGWALASMDDLNAIYDLRCELNDALEADSADNTLFWEGDELYIKNGSVYYALYMSSDEVPAGETDANGNEYFANRVFFKIFNNLGYSDVLYSAFDCINKSAPLRDNYFARATYTIAR